MTRFSKKKAKYRKKLGIVDHLGPFDGIPVKKINAEGVSCDDDDDDDANLQGAVAAISCGFVLTSPILRRVDEDGAVVVVIAVVVVC